MDDKLIKIDLSEEEVELFKQFRKNQDNFEYLLREGVFDLKNSEAILDFDSSGFLGHIKMGVHKYRKKNKT